MTFDHIFHEAKSKDAYLYDQDTVHIRLRAKIGAIDEVALIWGDPFRYHKQADTNRHAWAPYGDATPMKHIAKTTRHDVFKVAIKVKTKRVKYAFLINQRYLFGSREIIDLHETPAYRYNLFNYFNYPYLNTDDLFTPPAWVKDRIWYSIFPERFKNGNPRTNDARVKPWGSTDTVKNTDRFGGDIKGIEQSLDYLDNLGVNGLYLTPIFHGRSAHKYDTINYDTIDPEFGTKDDVKRLVKSAHERGFKVMLDAVFNHVGITHPFFLDVLKHGKDSPYYDAFYIIDPSKPLLPVSLDELLTMDRETMKKVFNHEDTLNYRTFAFTPFMPKINVMHPLVKQYFLDIAVRWIKETDIDGWRLDVSNEIPHAFWRAFRIAVKNAKADAYIVGENWDDSLPWLLGDQYDGVMNYGLLFPIWQFFGPHKDFETIDAHTFSARISEALLAYPDNVLRGMYNLLDSHDTARIKHICGENTQKVKLSYLFLFLLPGAPSIFYGDEVGLSGGNDPYNRRCMLWDHALQDHDLHEFMKRLIALRKETDAFKNPEVRFKTPPNKHALIVQRDDLIILINNRESATTFTLPAPIQATELWEKQALPLTDTFTLEGYQFKILKP